MTPEQNLQSPPEVTESESGETRDREEVAIEVWEDYYDVERSLTEDGYYVWTSAKSADRGHAEQSHIQHIRNGVDFLLTLYKSIPSDTPFLTEDTLRRACACFVAHDHHKRREEEVGFEDQFDISLSDAEDFMASCDLSTLSDSITAEELRGVMAAHHTTAEQGLHDSVPQSAFDAYHLVLVADAVSSNTNVSDMSLKIIQERLTSALGNHSYTIHKHSMSLGSSTLDSIANHAVANVLSESEDWRLLRQYGDGCLYLSLDSEDADTEGLATDVYDEFHSLLGDGHIAYSDDTLEASGLDTQNGGKYYDVSHRDVYYQGVINTAVGVMQRALRDAGNPKSFQKPERLRIERHITPYVDTDIQMETRHITGLARGIQSLYTSFVNLMVDESADEEWKRDPLYAMLHIFEVDTEENIEEVENLREENGDNLKVGSYQWNYKYIIAQYIYDTYYDGRDMTSLKNTFRSLFEANLTSLNGFDEYEETTGVDKIHAELKVTLARGLSIDGSEVESTLDTPLSHLTEYESGECDFCGGTTTAEVDGGRNDNHLLLKNPPEIQVKTDDGVVELENDSTVCYACQIEVATRQSHEKDWAESDENTLFVHYQTEYGFVPLSGRIEETLRSQSLDPSTLTPTPDAHADSVMADGEQPTVWDEPSYLDYKNWGRHSRGFHPRERFSGVPFPLADLENTEERYNAVISEIISAVYSGMSVHISKYPMVKTDESTGEVISFGEEVTKELDFFDGNLAYSDVRDRVEEALTVNHLADGIGFDSRIDTLMLLAEHSAAPASRLLGMAHDKGVEVDATHAAAVVRLDERFGGTLPSAERVARAFTALDTSADEGRRKTASHLRMYVRGDKPTHAPEEVNVDDSLSFHDAAAHDYATELERVSEREDLAGITPDIADAVYSRLKWQT